MDRVFRFSTFGTDSSSNAARALDPALDLTPIAGALAASGYAPRTDERGHLWGIREGSKLWRTSRPLERGDYGVRITRAAGVEQVSHLYEVLAVLPDPTIPTRLAIDWQGGTATWPVSIIFGPAIEVAPVPYVDMQARYGWQAPGGNWEALFVPTDIEETLDALHVERPPTAVVPPGRPLVINARRSAGTLRQQRSRTGQGSFKAAVVAAYGLHCAACDISGHRLLEAAHLVDEGWSDDRWDVGLPMCPNHHRLFDQGVLRLSSSCIWSVTEQLYASTVTKTDLTHLLQHPHADAIAWKLANPIAGRLGQ